MTETSGITIEYVPADSLVPAGYNPREVTQTALERLAKLIDSHGWVDPIIARREDRLVIGGHQRLKANELRKQPDGVVPVIYLDGLTDAKAKALNIALNNPHAMGEYDDVKLAELLVEIDCGNMDIQAVTGFAEGEIAELVTRLDEHLPKGDEDDVPDVQETAISKTGDLWLLGEHRLLCGDSATVAWDGDSLVYDPPWDADVECVRSDGWASVLAFADGGRAGDVVHQWGSPAWVFVWDCQACWYTPNRPLRRGKLCLWYGDLKSFAFDGAHYGEPEEARIVHNTRGEYLYRPDSRGKHLADVFAMQLTRLHASRRHKHEKPVVWVRLLIGDTTTGVVCDPFLGSGTTIIACEQLGRKCYAVEIEPRYVDVAVKRWQNLTGKQATLEGDGRTFEEIEAERHGQK